MSGSLDEFQGYHRDQNECDILLHSRWPASLLKKESGLFRSKWWDYRHLHPTIATDLFGYIFTVEMRKIIRAHINNSPPKISSDGKVRDWFPLGAGDLFNPPTASSRMNAWRRKISGVIKARQTADSDGIPYPFFIQAGLQHIYFGGGCYILEHVTLPMPSLLHNDRCLQRIREQWIDKMESGVMTGDGEHFKIPGDGSAVFKAHQNWLIGQVRERPIPRYAATRLVKEGYLTHDQVGSFL